MKMLVIDIGQELWFKELSHGLGLGPKNIPAYFTIGGFVSRVLPNIYVIAGVILFFFLIGGGLMFIVSAGQENPEGAAKGKQTVTAALLGFLIIFASYWIMQIIQRITGYDFGFPVL